MNRVLSAIAKRLPAHAGDRAEEFLFGLRSFETLQLPPTPAMTIICDDGELADLGVASVLDRHGVAGVFAVSPDLIGREGFLTYSQLRAIAAAGHEIAFHGTTHDPFTGFDGADRLLHACRDGVERLRQEQLGAPSTLVYPFGKHNRWVRKAIAPLFGCAFTTWFGLNGGRVNRYAIRRVPFGAYTGRWTANEAAYRGLIERCAGSGEWLALMLHPGAPEHGDEHNALLSRLITFAKESGVTVRNAQPATGSCLSARAGEQDWPAKGS